MDFSLNVGVEGDVAGAPVELNGTYSSRAFSARAKELIALHEPTQPLYMYIAPQNVHLGCGPDKATQGIQAPCETVGLYAHVLNDTFKVQSAVTTELDYVVGNVTDAMKAKGLWENTGAAIHVVFMVRAYTPTPRPCCALCVCVRTCVGAGA